MRRFLALVAVLMLGTESTAAASGDPLAMGTLAGIRGVWIDVSMNDDSAEAGRLNPTILRTAIELRLRQNGIRVMAPSTGDALLALSVVTLHGDPSFGGVRTFAVTLFVMQLVRLMRAPTTLASATTWMSTPMIGIVGSDNYSSAVRDAVNDSVDEFLNDYLAANPKK